MNWKDIRWMFLLLVASSCFVTACDYEQSVVKYDFNQGEIFVASDTNEIFIHDFQIQVNDSIVVHYPAAGDSIRRTLVNIDSYFQIDSKELLKNKEVFFSIGCGIKETGRMFDSCDEFISVSDQDSVYTLTCMAK